jgi:hypothetical protein
MTLIGLYCILSQRIGLFNCFKVSETDERHCMYCLICTWAWLNYLGNVIVLVWWITVHHSLHKHAHICWITSFLLLYWNQCTQYHSWLKHNSTSRKVTSLICNDFFNLRNSRFTIVLGSTQPLTKMGTRKSLGSKEHKADKLTAIYKPNV